MPIDMSSVDGPVEAPVEVIDEQVWWSVHSDYDDLPMTPEAYRVFGHLKRRAGKGNEAYPTLESIGEHCFRFGNPNASKASLKSRAVACIKELTAIGVVRDTGRRGKVGQRIYAITNRPEWSLAEALRSADNIHIRKGRPGRTRQSRSGQNDQGLTPLTPKIEGKGLTRLNGGVNPVKRGGLTRLNGGVNPVKPEDIPSEGIPSEDISMKEPPLTPQGGDGVCFERPGNDFQDPECSPTSDKSQGQGRASRKKRKSSNEIELRLPEKFDNFKDWYRQTIMSAYAPGRFGNASLAKKRWAALEKNNFHGYGIDGFRRGCQLFHRQLHEQMAAAGQVVGVPNIEQFVQGTQHGCPGHWQASLLAELETATAADPDEFSAEAAGLIPAGGGVMSKADRAAAEVYRRSYEMALQWQQEQQEAAAARGTYGYLS